MKSISKITWLILKIKLYKFFQTGKDCLPSLMVFNVLEYIFFSTLPNTPYFFRLFIAKFTLPYFITMRIFKLSNYYKLYIWSQWCLMKHSLIVHLSAMMVLKTAIILLQYSVKCILNSNHQLLPSCIIPSKISSLWQQEAQEYKNKWDNEQMDLEILTSESSKNSKVQTKIQMNIS